MTRRSSNTPARTVPRHGGAQRGPAAPSAVGSDASLETMTAEERSAVRRGLSDLQADRLATEAEIEAAFRRFRP
jgi:hypothetical protein